jgi:glutamate-1-semialdehyde 2,1-aminomutase
MQPEIILEQYSQKFKNSKSLFKNFENIFPNGVCHDIRSFKPFPFITEKADNIYLYDIDRNKILDLWMGHYANILGHNNPKINKVLTSIVNKGIHTGTTNIYQLKFAEKLQKIIPILEKLRFCTSGTEATMYALRVARAYTNKDLTVKIKGGWHGGNSDLSYSVKPPFNKPSTEGLKSFPPTLSIPLNNIETSKQILNLHKNEIAAIIIEPVLGAGGGIKADKNFLQMLRDFCNNTNSVLIFDETITAFRFRYGSISQELGIEPDMLTLGKIIGGGMHIGLYGGKADIMNVIEEKSVIVGGGTFSANPLTMSAGLEMINILSDMNYDELNDKSDELTSNIKNIVEKIDNIKFTGYKSLFALHFDNPVKDQLFKIAMLLNNMFTVHGGGVICFPHLTDDILENILINYKNVLEQIYN